MNDEVMTMRCEENVSTIGDRLNHEYDIPAVLGGKDR